MFNPTDETEEELSSHRLTTNGSNKRPGLGTFAEPNSREAALLMQARFNRPSGVMTEESELEPLGAYNAMSRMGPRDD